MKSLTKWTFFLLFFLLPSAWLRAENTQGFLTARMDTEAMLRTRVRVKGMESLLFGRLQSDKNGEIKGSAGFSTPMFSIGPVNLRGIMREIFRLGEYVPGSAVYEELPGIKLDSSIEGTGTPGAALYTPGRQFGSLLGIKKERLFWNLWGACETVSDFNLYGYAGMNRLYRNRGPDDQWVFKNPPFPGNSILHFAGGAAAGPKTRFVSLSLFSSLSALTPPGFAFRCSTKLLFAFLHLFGVCNITSPSFITPEGVYTKNLFNVGGRALLFPKSVMQLSAAYEKKVERKETFPAPSRKSSHTIEIAGTLELDVLTVTLGWKQQGKFDRLGYLSGRDNIYLNLKLSKNGRISFSLEPDLCRMTDGAKSLYLPVSVSLIGKKIRCEGKVHFHWAPDFSYKAAARITLKGEKKEGFVKIEVEPGSGEKLFDRLYIQVGWQSETELDPENEPDRFEIDG
jgi:hypothetical protein